MTQKDTKTGTAKSAAKHFAPKRDVQAAPPVEFSVDFLRDGEPETHSFVARPATSYGDLLGLVRYQGDETGRALPHMDNLIRLALLNTDGTPEKWKPEITADPETGDKQFLNPEKIVCPVDDLPKYLTFEAGSSRRRWVALTRYDEDVQGDIEVIASVFEHLASAAAERPTSPSSP